MKNVFAVLVVSVLFFSFNSNSWAGPKEQHPKARHHHTAKKQHPRHRTHRESDRRR